MALQGLSDTAAADGPVQETSVDGAYSYYREDKLQPKNTAGGERERMEIHSGQLRISTPLSDRADLAVDIGYESMSGASPWFVTPDLGGNRGGRPAQVMSQATIDDQRGDLLASGNYYYDWGKASLSSGFSIENDYYSVNFGLSGERHFNDKNTTVSAGTGVSLDWIDPTDARQFQTRPSSEDKQSVNFFAGISQVVTRHSAFQSTFSFDYATGYLSDPYKMAYVDSISSTVPDTRPDDRKQFTWLSRYRHHISGFNGTLHLDYKLYADDWSMTSHTFDIAYYQTLGWGFELIPSFRYYSQSQADFYEVFYDDLRADNLHSSDYRLSPYGAISYRIKAQWSLPDGPWDMDWVASLSYERYESSASHALQSVDVENPGLVSFRLYAIRLTARF